MLYHMISYDIIYNITSHHIIWYIIWHNIWHIMSYHITYIIYHIIPHHIISYISYHISYHMYPILSYIIYYKTHQNSTPNRKYIFHWQHHIYLSHFLIWILRPATQLGPNEHCAKKEWSLKVFLELLSIQMMDGQTGWRTDWNFVVLIYYVILVML